MKEVTEIRGKKSFAGPGMYGYDAEATVWDGERDLYVHVNKYDGFRHYTVSEKSVQDFMAGDGADPVEEFLEEYGKLDEAKQSEYAKVFDTLNKVITRMIKGV